MVRPACGMPPLAPNSAGSRVTWPGSTPPLLALMGDGRHRRRRQTARLWDVASGAEICRLKGHTAGVESAAFSPDGATVVTASEDGTARLWDAASGQELRSSRPHGRVLSPPLAPMGRRSSPPRRWHRPAVAGLYRGPAGPGQVSHPARPTHLHAGGATAYGLDK